MYANYKMLKQWTGYTSSTILFRAKRVMDLLLEFKSAILYFLSIDNQQLIEQLKGSNHGRIGLY